MVRVHLLVEAKSKKVTPEDPGAEAAPRGYAKESVLEKGKTAADLWVPKSWNLMTGPWSGHATASASSGDGHSAAFQRPVKPEIKKENQEHDEKDSAASEPSAWERI